MNPLAWFDKVTIISHPMTGRMDEIVDRLLNVGIEADVKYAQCPNDRFKMNNMRRNARMEFGCTLSHVKAILHALGTRRPLFLEDDIKFNDFAPLQRALTDLPGSWDVLYLGGHPCEPVERVGECLYRVGRFSFAEAYAINGTSIFKFIDFWLNRIGQPNAMFDQILGEFARDHEGYAVFPTITYQPNGYSHIAGRVDDKSNCVRSGWEGHRKG